MIQGRNFQQSKVRQQLQEAVWGGGGVGAGGGRGRGGGEGGGEGRAR